MKGAGVYTEIFNSDDKRFGGSGALNEGLLKAEKEKRGDYSYVIRPNVPPFGALILKRTRAVATPKAPGKQPKKVAEPKKPKKGSK